MGIGGKVKDPICGMDVKEDSRHRGSHKGKAYYFCSEQCKKTFDKDPGKYAK